MRAVKNLGIAAFVVLSVMSTAACGTRSAGEFVHSERVSKYTFKGTWPIGPDSGVLACDSAKGYAVTFTPAGTNTTYAVNGTADAWASKERWADKATISTSDNWGDVIGAGTALCEDSARPTRTPTR
jgi:hypothetical protein